MGQLHSRGGTGRRHGPPYVIIEGCIECGACSRECPHDAIFLDDSLEYVVDGALCPSCHRCPSACPVDAIVAVSDPRAVRIRSSQRSWVVDDWLGAPLGRPEAETA